MKLASTLTAKRHIYVRRIFQKCSHCEILFKLVEKIELSFFERERKNRDIEKEEEEDEEEENSLDAFDWANKWA
jgi:hypothetical protein